MMMAIQSDCTQQRNQFVNIMCILVYGVWGPKNYMDM